VGSVFIVDDWEVDWGVVDAMLSSIVPEVTGISHNCQKGVMECNKTPRQLPKILDNLRTVKIKDRPTDKLSQSLEKSSD